MFNSLRCRIIAIASLCFFTESVSQAQSFGEPGSFATKPTNSGAGDANVNLATGRIAPAIPLVTLPGVAGGVSIGLQYQGGAGIQVNATASEAGLGWALSGGGVIVRDVRGVPDDSPYGWIIDLGGNSYQGKYYENTGPNLHYMPLRTAGDVVTFFKARDGNVDHTPGGDEYYGAKYDNRNFLTWLYPASQAAKYEQYNTNGSYYPYTQPNITVSPEARYSGVFFPDTEPDVYTLTLPTGSLQFVLDPKGKPVLLQAQSIKIEPLGITTPPPPAASSGKLEEFLVTTSDGVKYYFGSDARYTSFKEHVLVKSTVLEIGNMGSKADASYINKWHLAKIVYPSGEVINYAYSNDKNYELSTNNYLQQDWVFTALNGNRYYNCYSCMDRGHAWHKRDWQRRYTVRTTVLSTDTKQLVSITSAQGSINFSYQSAVRKDIGGTTQPLSTVKLLNKRGDLIKQLDLVQHYADNGQTVQNAMPYDRYHLMLDRVVDRGTGCNYVNLWQFDYNKNTFCRNAATKDYWGYLNGVAYPTDGTLVASYARPIVATNYYSLPGRNRDPSAVFTQYMILQSITAATGAAQNFAYQLNDENVTAGSSPSIRPIGGLRIASVSKYDGVSHSNDIVEEFTYRKATNPNLSSGTLGDGGMYVKLQVIHDRIINDQSSKPDDPSPSDDDLRGKIPDCYDKNSSNNSRADYYYLLRSDATMYEYASDYIDYSCVTVSHGTKGKTRYEFTSWADASHQDYTDAETRQVGNNLNVCPNDPLNPTYRGAVLDLPFSLELDGLSLLSYVNGNPVYTQGISADFPRRTSRSAERGLPMLITQLTTNDIAVAATIYQYDFSRSAFVSPTVQTPLTLPTVNAVYVKPSLETFGFSQYFSYFQLYYYKMASQWCPLISTTEIIYNQQSAGDIAKSVASKTTIEYANFFPSKITKSTTACSSPTICQSNALGQYQVTEYRRAQSPSFADGTLGGTADQTTTAGLLRNAGMLATVIEQEQYTTANLNGPKIDHISASLNTYKLHTGHVVPYETYASPTVSSFAPATIRPVNGNWSFDKDPSYRLISTVTDYTLDGLPVNTIGREGIPQAVIWGYGHTLPIATVTNGAVASDNSQLATAGHTSFEEDGADSDGWTMPIAANFSSEAKTGARSARYFANQYPYGLGKTLVIPKGTNQKGKLVFSCWAKIPASVTSSTSFLLVASSSLGGYDQSPTDFQIIPGQDWKYCEFIIDLEHARWGNAGASRDLPLFFYLWVPSGTGELLIDEARIHRADAQMNTMTYQPLVGKTSSTGADGRTTYFTYSTADNSPLLVLNHNRDVLSRTQSKLVNEGKLTANFENPGCSTPQTPVTFTAALNGCADGTSFLWNFGDNTTATGTTVSHPYASSGTYQVSLITTNPQRGVDRITKSVQVGDLLYITEQGDTYVDFCENPNSNGFTLTAEATASCGQPITYQWQSRAIDKWGNPMSAWANIPGKKGASFSSQVSCGQTIYYRCILIMPDGSTNENDPNLPEVFTSGNNQSSSGTGTCGC